MRWRVIAFVSLGLNVVLGAVWLSATSQRAANAPAVVAQTSAVPAKTNVVVRRQYFTWQDIESPNFPTYVANLRQIGCPEQTIRDIIIAEVNAMYSRKRAVELVTPDQQWWRSQPDANVFRAALAEIPGAGSPTARPVDGPAGDQLGYGRFGQPSRGPRGLAWCSMAPCWGRCPAMSSRPWKASASARRTACRLTWTRSATRTKLLIRLNWPSFASRPGRNWPTSSARRNWRSICYVIRRTPTTCVAEFGQLRFFSPTPDEFRGVFRATDALDQRIQLLANATDPGSVEARKALEAQRENAIKVALGPKRYEEYRMLHDPVYQDAVAAAQQAGTPGAAQTIYAVNLATLAEEDRIRGDTNLTSAQKAIELKRAELDQLQANTVVAGQDLPPRAAAPAAVTPAAESLCPRPGRQRGYTCPHVRPAGQRP